ncbi:PREDICTED: uncharacterized protein LOC109226485 isoform X2 [Nicotiana attenuata]|uniref:uncharacterized protein LOC109226485 isoform X2 n=1 Tax=Nicotiana attenuata TaxID=49451 RepID=UPI000904F687|nr:PREDICTED: uncharacterized protein LOC109226485 isoform X2 [Nicotiana attenuata]
MANSLCFTPLASFNSVNKPGLINGNCTGRKIQWIKDVTYSSKSSLRVLEVKATDSDRDAKARSIICKNCDGNASHDSSSSGSTESSSVICWIMELLHINFWYIMLEFQHIMNSNILY